MNDERKPSKGQILVGVVLIMLVLLIIVPPLIQWVQQDSRLSVRDRKNTTAFNLAQAAVDRGYWKAKSSTATIAAALAGTSIPGYEFDSTYSDLPGGTYRIWIGSASADSITIIGEGRDSSTNQVRSVNASFQNRTIYSPLLAEGDINYQKGIAVFWGPLMSQGNIKLDNTTAAWYFDQKYARSDVIGTAANPRDTSWPLPPNTDNTEWWANYQYVPELPILDFATLRSSAAATNTLNVYGCKSGSKYTDPTTGNTLSGAAPWDKRSSCGESSPHYSGSGGTCTGASCHFGNPYQHPKSAKFGTPYVWYWDGDVTLSGSWCGSSACGNSTGLLGTVIVRGNLTIDSPGEYNYTGHVPTNAWKQHQKITATISDTAASGQYPADLGFQKSNTTFKFGTDSFCFPTSPPSGTTCGFINTVGIKGFTYVGGNLVIKNFMDFNGAVWVNGTVSASCPSSDPTCAQSFCGIMYDDTLSVPSLNVVLVRTSWEEVSPSTWTWR